ncbi:MAG TPA: OmpA family protein [Kofleriaceae bacterium]|jgi:outer membrane protein OmpA-like peptidoglycan-associated protein
MRTILFALLATASVAACHKNSGTSTAPMTANVTATVDEPEEAPVVKEEPKSLDIQKDVIRLKPGMKILFETDSDKIVAESNTILDEVADVMTQNQKLRIRVEGHTDNTGKEDHNKELSEKRATAVRAYLVSKGVAEDRLESTGCGQGTPVADNATDDGKQQNRRVEFVIMRHKHPREACQLYKPGEHHGHHHDETATGGGQTPPASAP